MIELSVGLLPRRLQIDFREVESRDITGPLVEWEDLGTGERFDFGLLRVCRFPANEYQRRLKKKRRDQSQRVNKVLRLVAQAV